MIDNSHTTCVALPTLDRCSFRAGSQFRSGFEDQWQRRFRDFAQRNDDDAGIAGWSRTGLEARLNRFAGLWGGASGTLWLDAGCGAGTYMRWLITRGVRVIGLDYSLLTVQKAARRTDRASFLVGDLRALPLPDHAVDGVLCFGVTQALGNASDAIAELTRILKPGGELWIDGLNRWCVPHLLEIMWRRITGRPAHLTYLSASQLRAILTGRGYNRVRVDWLPIAPAKWRRLQQAFDTSAGIALFRYVPLLALLASHSFVVQAQAPPARR